MAYIFISYSRKDQDYAAQLADDLTKRGFDVWIDNRNIDFGDDWFNEIEKGIIGCAAFIILMSPESKESHWVKREILLAYKQKKSIFPLLLEGEEFPILIELQFADVRDAKLPPDSFYERLAKVVQPKDSTGQIIVHRPKSQPNPKDSRRLRGLIGVIVLAILIAVIGIVFSGVLGGDENNGDSQETATNTSPAIAQNPSPTEDPTDEPTEAITEAVTEISDPAETATLTARDEAETLVADQKTATATYWTATPTSTPTPTVTPSETEDRPATVAMELTNIYWETATAETHTPTATITHSPTYTPTHTATSTATNTPTNILTNTATPTATLTASSTDSPSPTFTATNAQLGFGRVYQNDEWTPHVEVINGETMMLVPVGCFMMGSLGGQDDEKPVEEQCFDAPFWIDKYEVTRGDYVACVAAGGCTETPDSQYSIRDTQPINRVTWFEATVYCGWREARLPTEKEWEYAARGPSNWIYPWGNEFIGDNIVSNYGTADVGSRRDGHSWVGANDLSGNVWEWVSSWYIEYPYNPSQAESNTSHSYYRVTRGGGFIYDDDSYRSAGRNREYPSVDHTYIGFRCARSY